MSFKILIKIKYDPLFYIFQEEIPPPLLITTPSDRDRNILWLYISSFALTFCVKYTNLAY